MRTSLHFRSYDFEEKIWSKLYNIRQDDDEQPATYVCRVKKLLQKLPPPTDERRAKVKKLFCRGLLKDFFQDQIEDPTKSLQEIFDLALDQKWYLQRSANGQKGNGMSHYDVARIVREEISKSLNVQVSGGGTHVR